MRPTVRLAAHAFLLRHEVYGGRGSRDRLCSPFPRRKAASCRSAVDQTLAKFSSDRTEAVAFIRPNPAVSREHQQRVGPPHRLTTATDVELVMIHRICPRPQLDVLDRANRGKTMMHCISSRLDHAATLVLPQRVSPTAVRRAGRAIHRGIDKKRKQISRYPRVDSEPGIVTLRGSPCPSAYSPGPSYPLFLAA